MKLPFVIAFLTCWTALSTASDDYFFDQDFPSYVDESHLFCQDNLLSLNFSNAVIQRIGPNFISSSLITCLDLRNNNIELVEHGAFSKLPKLTNLYLSHNQFNSPEDIFLFGGHEMLKVLILNYAVKNYGNVEIIEIKGSYPNLEILSIRQNHILDVHVSKGINVTTMFPKLKALDLSDNNIEATKLMDLLPRTLDKLYLARNSLVTLRFSKNSDITILTLDGNRIRHVIKYSNNPFSEGFWTSGLDNLRYISLSKNNIEKIESTAFQRMTHLTYLNLSDNAISYVYGETFAYPPSLKTLDLSRNNFDTVVKLQHDTNITYLSMRCNKITKIEAYAFKHTSNLTELLLNGNQISVIDTNGFANLHRLEILDLSRNELSSLPKGWSDVFSSLRYLDLSNNQFTSLTSLSLSSMLPLEEIHLASNPLKYLDANSFQSLPKNAIVILVHNGTVGMC